MYGKELAKEILGQIQHATELVLKRFEPIKSVDDFTHNPAGMEKLDAICMQLIVIGEGLKIKGVKNWYFGLETALKLNTMTHEYFTIDYVISDQYRTTKTIHILDKDFKFIKWRSSITTFGIIKTP